MSAGLSCVVDGRHDRLARRRERRARHHVCVRMKDRLADVLFRRLCGAGVPGARQDFGGTACQSRQRRTDDLHARLRRMAAEARRG